MNKWFNKLTKVFIVIGMILSMCFSAGNTTSVEAWDNTIPHEFTRIKEINYPWWWSKKIGSTKQWSTVMTKYNGKYAYCLEASKKSPSAGNYPAEVIDNNEAVRKLLYYGFGGPGYNQAVRDMYTIELNSCVPDDFGDKHGNFDDGAYLFTHIWLSYAYSGDLMGLNLKDFNTKWPNGDGVSGYGDNILWGYNWIMSQPDIGYAKWNPTDSKYGTSTKLTASYDPANRIQYTNTVTLEGNNAQANLTLQDEVTLHNVTTGETQTGGTYTLNAAQSFYLTAPNKNISDYQSNNVAGAGCERFTVLAIKDGASGTQTEGSWEIDPDSRQLYYSVDWLDFGDVEIQKLGIGQDNHQSGLVEGLNGAEFTLKLQSEVNEKSWDNASTYDVITTANNSNGKKGYATTTNLPYGKYIIRETKTPDGYVTCPDLIYEISKETDNITLNNDITTAYVKLVKKDANDLQRIKNLALSTSNSHLPQILAKQQMLLNVENMRRNIALVYSASDPTISRNAGITAQALIAESVFEETSVDFSSKMDEIRPQLLRLIELRQQSYLAEDRLHHAEIFFSNVLGRLLMRAGMEYSYPLRHSARHLDKDFSRNTANKQGLQESLRPLMDMCAKAEQADPPERTLLKDCGEFRTNWDGIVSNWTQLARGHVEAKQLWNTLDGKLRELSDAVSTHEAEWIYRSMSHINEEVSRIKELFPIMGTALLAGLLATLLLIHLQILRPLSLLSQALRTIRSGHSISELPRVRIRELQDVLDVLPDISRHMDELNTRSGQLAQERDQYADLSFRDALTGVYNRRALEETMERIPACFPA